MADYSKLIKILQYVCVITSEYNLAKYHLRGVGIPSAPERLFGGATLTDDETKDLKMRYKKLGSALSTVRMVTRFGDFLESIRWFFAKITKLFKGEIRIMQESKLTWLIKLLEFCSGIFDNWVFLARIQIVRYTTKWQKTWVDWLSSFFALCCMVFSFFEKLL